MKLSLILTISILALLGCAHKDSKKSPLIILPVEEVDWEKLNPARGDKSPQAGTLWGDRKGSQATGFLAKFVDGFSSPPHIHNVSYRAIVIDGEIHNDDPKAADMWMPQGSYWTQPAGEAHITSAKGETNIALVEIDQGPYLVKPTKMKFDNGERPFNIHSSNIIWKNQGNYKSTDLWVDRSGDVTGSLIQFNKKFSVDIENSKLVVIQGKLKIQSQVLNPGSLVTINDSTSIKLECLLSNCIIYKKL